MSQPNSCELSSVSDQSLLPLADGGSVSEAVSATENPSAWRDYMGIVASVACAIHCAAMPFVIGFLPALGLSFLADEAFHKWMAGACFLIALASFLPGWRRHGRLFPAAIATTGLTIVTAAAFGLSGECCAACELDSTVTSATSASATSSEDAAACCEHCAIGADQTTAAGQAQASFVPAFVVDYAAWWTPIGGLLLVCGHLLNHRFASTCDCCDH